MLLSDGIYKRIPLFWMILGLLFLFFGLSGGSDLQYFLAYIGFAVLCIGRSIWIYQARWKFHKRNQVSIMRDTMVIKHPIADNYEDKQK
jgi:hypothetical protein